MPSTSPPTTTSSMSGRSQVKTPEIQTTKMRKGTQLFHAATQTTQNKDTGKGSQKGPSKPQISQSIKCQPKNVLMPITNTVTPNTQLTNGQHLKTTIKCRKQKDKQPTASTSKLQCKFCPNQYTHRGALFKHVRRNHPTRSTSQTSGSIKCQEENRTFICRYLSDLRLHLKKIQCRGKLKSSKHLKVYYIICKIC